MPLDLTNIIRLAGIGQLGILIASALVPDQLDWKTVFAPLPKLYRQLFWTYGGYVVLGILFNGLVCLIAAPELAAGGKLARVVCAYITLFWGIRLGLQLVFDAKPYLKLWWHHAGYHLLTVLFATFTALFAYAALH